MEVQHLSDSARGWSRLRAAASKRQTAVTERTRGGEAGEADAAEGAGAVARRETIDTEVVNYEEVASGQCCMSHGFEQLCSAG